MFALRLVFILMLALLCLSCSGGRDFEGPIGPSRAQESSSGTLRGFVVRVNPVLFVDELSLAPEGSRPLAGALVSALDLRGRVLGMSFTDPDGGYELGQLPSGLVRLEVRESPTQVLPDAEIEVTVAAEHLVAVGRQHPVTRAQAIAQVLPQASPEALVVCSLNPLPAGSRLSSRESDPEQDLTLQRDKWFLLVDPQPQADTPHPVEYFFIDAESGELEKELRSDYPILDGERIWTDFELFDYSPFDPLSPFESIPTGFQPQPRSELVQMPESGLLFQHELTTLESILAQEQVEADGLFVVLLAGDNDRTYPLALGKVRDLLTTRGVPGANIEILTPDTSLLRPNSGLGKIEFLPLHRELYLRDLAFAFRKVNHKVELRASEGKKSNILFYYIGHGSSVAEGQLYLLTEIPTFRGKDLIDLGFFRNQACEAQVFIEACFSEGFLTTSGVGLLEQLGEAGLTNIPHEVEMFAAARINQVAGLGILANAVASLGDLAGGRIGGLLDGTSFRPEFVNLVKPGLGQDPVFLRRPGAPDRCPDSSGTPVGPPPSAPPTLRSEVVIVNETNHTIRIGLKTNQGPLNEGKNFRLFSGDSEVESFLGDIRGLNIEELVIEGAQNNGNDLLTAQKTTDIDVRGGIRATIVIRQRNTARGSLFQLESTVAAISQRLPDISEQPEEPSFELSVDVDLQQSGDQRSVQFSHLVGVSPCPRSLDPIFVENRGNRPIQVRVSPGEFLSLDPATGPLTGGAFEILPGTIKVFQVAFDCGTQESFSSSVRVEATGPDGESASAEVIYNGSLSTPPGSCVTKAVFRNNGPGLAIIGFNSQNVFFSITVFVSEGSTHEETRASAIEGLDLVVEGAGNQGFSLSVPCGSQGVFTRSGGVVTPSVEAIP